MTLVQSLYKKQNLDRMICLTYNAFKALVPRLREETYEQEVISSNPGGYSRDNLLINIMFV